MTTNQKGAIAETAIIHAATKLDIPVYRPVAEGGRCDLIIELGERLVRVQCKTAVHRGDVLAIPCYSARRTGTGFVKQSYTRKEIDAIVAYSPELDRCFYLPIELAANRCYVQLRLRPTRNNQKRGIHPADDFAFESLRLIAAGP